MFNSLNYARDLFYKTRAASKGKFWFIEIFPGPLFNYCANWQSFQTYKDLFVSTYFHACGTCRMVSNSIKIEKDSNDNTIGVVDEEFKVFGTRYLRIVDASVIPQITTGPISAVCMALGLAAGRLITEK